MPATAEGAPSAVRSSCAIAVDFGGTSLRVARAEGAGVLGGVLKMPSELGLGLDPFLARLSSTILRVAGGDLITEVCVACPGPLDSDAGVILKSPNASSPTPGWTPPVPLAALLQARIEAPVVLENDANAAALGEASLGAGAGAQSVLYVTVSTGVGAGFVLDGDLVRGSSGNFGELGHTVLSARGPRCGCGGRGCLEALASGVAISRSYAARTGEDLPVEAIAARGDSYAREVMTAAAHWLGIGLVNAAHLLDPSVIVVGGGVSRAPDFLDRARRTFRRRAMPSYRASPIRSAALADDSGLHGAAILARRHAEARMA